MDVIYGVLGLRYPVGRKLGAYQQRLEKFLQTSLMREVMSRKNLRGEPLCKLNKRFSR
jgi:hypothetical protein